MSEMQNIFGQHEIRNVINYVHITDKQILVLKLNEFELNLSNPRFFFFHFSLQELKNEKIIYMKLDGVIFDSLIDQ